MPLDGAFPRDVLCVCVFFFFWGGFGELGVENKRIFEILLVILVVCAVISWYFWCKVRDQMPGEDEKAWVQIDGWNPFILNDLGGYSHEVPTLSTNFLRLMRRTAVKANLFNWWRDVLDIFFGYPSNSGKLYKGI